MRPRRERLARSLTIARWRSCSSARLPAHCPEVRDELARVYMRPEGAESLARAAGLSRSVFSERFSQKVGAPPMQYLMDWRMALAKAMLQRDAPPLEAVAAAIGYQSASAFSTAFRREVGSPPSHFARTTTS